MSIRIHLRTALGGACAAATASAAALLLAGAPATALADSCPQAPPASQTSQSFGYAGYPEQFAVPPWVDTLTVTVRGGHGGSSAGKTAAGGRPGVVTGTVPVTPGSCLDVVVGAYGGGFGLGDGGLGGGMSGGGMGFSGNGGGGASGIRPQGGSPFVVAGGGGGAGGNSFDFDDPQQGTPGSAGGDGAGGRGPGTPQGSPGLQPPYGDPQLPLWEPVGGRVEASSSGDGVDAIRWEFYEVLCGSLSGGGGGGGGGAIGGGAGLMLIPQYDDVHNDLACLAYGFGGGGGAGGDSAAAASVVDPTFSVDPGTCPPDGALVPACAGAIELDWSVDVGAIAPAGGGAQSATIGSRYPGTLQAQVTARDGAGIPGLAVSFALPDLGPSASFETGEGAPRSITVTTDDSGVATTPPLIAGTIVGAFSATARVGGISQSARFALANEPAGTATSLWTLPADPSVAGEPVRFAAEVRQAPSTAPDPVGVVAFELDGRQVGVIAVDGDGLAISDPLPLPVGGHPVRAVFHPGSQFTGSAATLTQRVVRASTAVDVVSSANPSEDDDPVRFTATVAPVAPGAGTPSGSVAFALDGSALGAPVPLVGGVAQTSAVRVPAGTHGVTATYGGDDGYEPSAGSFVQSVGATATATVLSAVPRNPVVGQAAQITATVRPPSARSSAVPTGGVDVLVDGIVVCDGVTLVDAGATCTVTAPSLPGAHEITARYVSGSPDFDDSQGSLSQLVSKGRAHVALEASPDPSAFGEPVRLHAQVAAAGAASGAPSGAVTFTVDGARVGQPVLLRDGLADSVAIPRLDAGPHVLRASYGGDASFFANAVGATQAVDRGATLATLIGSAPDALLGAAPRFTLRLGAAPPASGVLRGEVQFSVDGRRWGPPLAVEDGAAVSAPVTGLRAGAHLVRASYLGTSGFTPVDAQLIQRIGTLPRALVPPLPPPDPSIATIAPQLKPAQERSPLLCTRQLAISAVGVHGERVRIRGVADVDLVGQRVALASGGRTLARPTVRPDGGFSASVPRPRGLPERDVTYVATAGSARSEAVGLEQRLRIERVGRAGRGRVRVVAVLDGAGAQPMRARVERRIACGRARVVARPQVRAALAGSGGRRIVVTVARPPRGAGTAAIRVLVGRRTASLPHLLVP